MPRLIYTHILMQHLIFTHKHTLLTYSTDPRTKQSTWLKYVFFQVYIHLYSFTHDETFMFPYRTNTHTHTTRTFDVCRQLLKCEMRALLVELISEHGFWRIENNVLLSELEDV